MKFWFSALMSLSFAVAAAAPAWSQSGSATGQPSVGLAKTGNFSKASSRAKAPEPASKNTDNGGEQSQLGEDLRRQVEELKLLERQRGPRFSMVGDVAAEGNNIFSINGERFSVGENARVFGQFGAGVYAEVSGPLGAGPKTADSINVIELQAASTAEQSNGLGKPLR